MKGEKDLNDLELVGLKYEDEGLYSEMTEVRDDGGVTSTDREMTWD